MPQPIASQRPFVHRFEQHCACAVHVAFVCRHVPEARQAPMRHPSPAQHSAGCEHGSFVIRHWARHVPVGPQKP